MAPLQAPSPEYAAHPVVKGLIEGYGTMDALASLVFAIIVINAVRSMGFERNADIMSLTARAGLVAVTFLAIVYAFVAYMGASSVGVMGFQENGAAVLAKERHTLLWLSRQFPAGRHRGAGLPVHVGGG